ncbi:hypothetical protein ACO0LM_25175 [Undibacterium sp. Di26W]|uniref:hypothetical protein n=1 Tax=Undibacterium sp. Di26W TaxID=3413035 RepID=UPI003BF422BD
MFMMELPATTFQETAQHSTIVATTQVAEKFDRTIGICHLSENFGQPLSAADSMSPILALENYYRKREKTKIEGNGIATILKAPTNGALSSLGSGNFLYLPNKGFIGNDRATLFVKFGEKRVKVEYFFKVMQSVPLQYETGPSPYEESGCPKKVRVWKISDLTKVHGKAT